MADYIKIGKRKYEVVDPGHPLFIVQSDDGPEFRAVRALPAWCTSEDYEFIGGWREDFHSAVEDASDWLAEFEADTGRE